MKKMSKKELEKQKDKTIEALDHAINELTSIRTAIEFNKKIPPYYFLLGGMFDGGKFSTQALGNLSPYEVSGFLQQYIITLFTQKK